MIRLNTLAATFASMAWLWLPNATRNLSGVELKVSEIADSGDYFVYRYMLTNPASSTWGIASVNVDVAAPAGTPDNLPATGRFLDASVASPDTPHAEVGPISPEGWGASLDVNAELSWYPPSTGLTTSDSVAPGETRGGFGIRSSYFPGIRTITAEPTVESCCLVIPPSADGPYYPSPGGFAVSGYAVAPRYLPTEVDVSVLREQVRAVCSTPLWVDDLTLCQSLGAYLDDADIRLAAGDVVLVLAAIDSFLRAVTDNRTPAGGVSDEAYWLLSLNAKQVSTTLSSRR